MGPIDCNATDLSTINETLRSLSSGASAELANPGGRHNLAVGLERGIEVKIDGHVGYYCGGMNQGATIRVSGNTGQGVGENMMAGEIRVDGFASAAAGASAHGGLLVVKKDVSIRCGISLKGAEIVVGGNAGNMCGFMAQLGTIIICGDAAQDLGDSLYEAVIYVGGEIAGLGADAEIQEMTESDRSKLQELLNRAGIDKNPASFRRVASAKELYYFDASKRQAYG
ncbi:MAG: protein glxC [Acidobacteria bacterium]|nr:protein glxC [Acidobacteriota bacterium]